jgi:hypothetical protein
VGQIQVPLDNDANISVLLRDHKVVEGFFFSFLREAGCDLELFLLHPLQCWDYRDVPSQQVS